MYRRAAVVNDSRARCRAMTPVTVNGRLVYAACVETGRGLRVRLDADEAERLGLFEGHMAQVGVRGHAPAAYHVLSVVAVDPCWVWVELSVAPVLAARG
jgi:hypothetical protein